MFALAMKGITKRFKNVTANDGISFQVERGSIHGLVGENGAGKSTLMNILYGLLEPDEGEILIYEKSVKFRGPKDAINAGIGMVHQHFMLVGPLTVTENIILGSEPVRGIFLDSVKAQETVVGLEQKYGLAVTPTAKIEEMSVGLAQRVEILKTLYRGAQILILDEPTAVLTPQEVRELIKIMQNLKNDGVTIIFISHKIKEIKEITDEITVIRAGKIVGTVKTKEVQERDIARMMVGRDVSLTVEKAPPKLQGQGLVVEDLQAKNDKGLQALRNISFEVNRGEILGIAGVEGNGQSELIEVLAGLRRATGGKVSFHDSKGGVKEITNATPRHIYDNGFAHIPEDRHKRGLQLKFSIEDNLVTSLIQNLPFSKNGFIDTKAITDNALEKIKKFDIRCGSHKVKLQNLSGGNQQKVVVAREFSKDPQVILISQPTRGVDIGAIEFIHNQIIALRDKGVAILLISAELSEIFNLSDRIAVMYEGRIIETIPVNEANEEKVGLLMAGIKSSQAEGLHV